MRLLAIPLLGLVVLLFFGRRLGAAALLVVASAALPLLRHDRLAATAARVTESSRDQRALRGA